MEIKPIKTKADYKAALKVTESHDGRAHCLPARVHERCRLYPSLLLTWTFLRVLGVLCGKCFSFVDTPRQRGG